MRYISLKFFILTQLLFGIFLKAQVDPAAMTSFTKLSPTQQQKLLNQYRSSSSISSNSKPSVELPNRPLEKQESNEESFDDRSDFLYELNSMEKIISADVSRLQSQVDVEDSSGNNELLEALDESKALLRKIKELQRREIEKRAEEFSKSESDAIKPFGYDLFASHPSTYAPGNQVPFPNDYKIGIGDTIDIQLYGRLIDSYSLLINGEGTINFPGIGPINVFENGVNFFDLKNLLKQKIAKNLGQGVESSITLGAFRSIRIFLLGEVREQGAYTVSALSTTINALLSCGGIKQTGSLRKIQLKRAGEIVSTLDLYDLLLSGDTSADKSLQPGDVIFVPIVEKQVTISGAVKRPAKYEIIGEESLSDIIEISGGLNGNAYLPNIRLERLGEDYRPLVKNLSFPSDSKYRILPSDVISIPFATTEVSNSVSLIGNVERPGEYEWKAGMQLKDIISGIKDLLPKTDMNYGLIRRKLRDGTIKVLNFSPATLFSKTLASSILLDKEDVVYFFSTDRSRNSLIDGILMDLSRQGNIKSPKLTVSVGGLVRFPGQYPLTENMSLFDLVNASGGLLDAAYSLSAEISRMKVDSNKTASIEHVLVSALSDINRSKACFMKPYDHLHIKKVPYWSENHSFTLSGEILFPGSYQISRGESLADVIKRAGGFTNKAFPGGAVFTRLHLKKKESAQKDEFINKLENLIVYEKLEKGDNGDGTLEQSRALISRLRSTPTSGRLVIDLESQIDRSADTEILLLDGDSLFVPAVPQEVIVTGEVLFPTSHLADNTLSVTDYIERSGGLTDRSDESRIALIKSNGMILSTSKQNAWFSQNKSQFNVQAGDMIVVPVKIDLPSKWLQNFSTSTQILYQLAVAAAAVNSF